MSRRMWHAPSRAGDKEFWKSWVPARPLVPETHPGHAGPLHEPGELVEGFPPVDFWNNAH